MKRLVKMIEQCQECDHSTNNSKDFTDNAWVCNKNGQLIENIYEIADHCKLPDGRRGEDN